MLHCWYSAHVRWHLIHSAVYSLHSAWPAQRESTLHVSTRAQSTFSQYGALFMNCCCCFVTLILVHQHSRTIGLVSAESIFVLSCICRTHHCIYAAKHHHHYQRLLWEMHFEGIFVISWPHSLNLSSSGVLIYFLRALCACGSFKPRHASNASADSV